jgi:DNA helicase-2/ATP-dependent DNA helicase PcrA
LIISCSHYNPPKEFSYSRISAYQKCPYQYKLAYVLNLPSKGSPHFSFGNTVHSTLQAFYEKVQDINSATQVSLFETVKIEKKKEGEIKVPSQEELLKLYKEKWIPDWYKNKNQREEYFTKGEELLKEFYQSQKDNWTIPVSIEGGFKIKVGEYLVKGRIDRIDQLENSNLEIIDYKTGQPKDKLTIDDKQQLLIYQIAVETLPQYKNLGKIEKLTFFYLNENKRMSFVGTNKDKEKLEAKLSDAIEKIREGDFTPTPNQYVCQYCDFKEICEFRQL